MTDDFVDVDIDQLYADLKSDDEDGWNNHIDRNSDTRRRMYWANLTIVTAKESVTLNGIKTHTTPEKSMCNALSMIRTYERMNNVKVRFISKPYVCDCRTHRDIRKLPAEKRFSYNFVDEDTKLINIGYTKDFVDFLRSKGYTVVRSC